MEAMAAGLPAVSTPVAAVPEMVKDGQTGFTHSGKRCRPQWPDGSPNSLDDPVLAKSPGAAGRELCEEQFAIGRTLRLLCQILKDHDAIADRSGGLPAFQRNAA